MFDESNLVNKLATVAVVGLLSWNVMSTSQLTTDVAVMKVTIANLETTLINNATSYMTRGEALSNNQFLEQKVERLEQWNQNLSERIRNLEQKLIDERRRDGERKTQNG